MVAADILRILKEVGCVESQFALVESSAGGATDT